jgi:two-component system KDP operon response regulator KdpE
MNIKTSLLIIDDEKDFCKVIVKILDQEPYEVECAFTLMEAEKILIKYSPDFVLLDNNLPDGKGIDFLREHRLLFENSKVVMMTANASDQLRKAALLCNVYEFLEKPFSLAKLMDLLSSVPVEM